VSTGPSALAGAPVLVVASNNEGKLREFRRLLRAGPWNVLSLAEAGWIGALDEPGETYAANALAKATAVSGALGLPTLADDSGIEVDALAGWPGPRSARWLGPGATDRERLAGLITEVDRRCPGERRVRYVCVVALSRPGSAPTTAEGQCLGTLVEPAGPQGFGYDAAFLSDDLGVTFGEAADADKDGISHRARALDTLAAQGVLEPPGVP
jgi:XTP/dITP diphosphohydrolase